MDYRSLAISWDPPEDANGIITSYVASKHIGVKKEERVACYFDVPKNVSLLPPRPFCIYNGVEVNTSYDMSVIACTKPNEAGHGGGCSKPSAITSITTWTCRMFISCSLILSSMFSIGSLISMG